MWSRGRRRVIERRAAMRALAPLLAALLAAAAAGRAAAAPDLGVLAPQAGRTGFAQATAPRRFAFPADHGPHPDFRQEWWYFTGNLDADGGERFGFELTFFRFALAPPEVSAGHAGAAADPISAWRARQVYMAHFAVTDVTRKRFRYEQRYERDALGLAGAADGRLQVWLDDWSAGNADPSGTWRLVAAGEDYALELEADPSGPPALNGDQGFSRKSAQPGSASYYYSVPRVPVTGRLWRGERALRVHGTAWLDREWGSGGLGASETGWDWYALQLADGSALMFYALRERDGGLNAASAGTFVATDGSVRALARSQVQVEVLSWWDSPRGGRYPARWHIRVPSESLELTVNPVLADQELATQPRYWEGAVDAQGMRAGRALGGRGYIELVGYAPGR